MLQPYADKEIPKAVLACMELLVRRKHGLISDNEWETLCRLQSHIDDFKQNGSYGSIELMTQDMFNRDFVAAMYARASPYPLSSYFADFQRCLRTL
jgi:hypothetical protein